MGPRTTPVRLSTNTRNTEEEKRLHQGPCTYNLSSVLDRVNIIVLVRDGMGTCKASWTRRGSCPIHMEHRTDSCEFPSSGFKLIVDRSDPMIRNRVLITTWYSADRGRDKLKPSAVSIAFLIVRTRLQSSGARSSMSTKRFGSLTTSSHWKARHMRSTRQPAASVCKSVYWQVYFWRTEPFFVSFCLRPPQDRGRAGEGSYGVYDNYDNRW